MNSLELIANAEIGTVRYPYIDGKSAPLGNFLLEVAVFKRINSRKDGLDKFVAELKIIESDVKERPVGSYMQFFKAPQGAKWPSMVAGEIKGFIAAVLQTDPKEVTLEDVEEAVSTENPLKGQRVRAAVSRKPTKAGGEVTVVRFSPV